MTGMISKWLRGAMVLGAIVAATGLGEVALAAPPARPSAPRDQGAPNRVRVEVKVVSATVNGQMDPRLQGIAKELRANFEQFRGFQLLSVHGDTLGPNQSTSFQFDGGRRGVVTLISKGEIKSQVRVEVFNRAGERTFDTSVGIPNGKMMAFGIKSQDGRLILPVSIGM